MSSTASSKVMVPAAHARRKRSPLMRGCSALAAAIAMAGLWSAPAQAQLAVPSSVQAPPALDANSILQMRNAPEIRSIASAPYIADTRISLDPPVVPNSSPSLPNAGGAPIPVPQPNNSGGDQHQTISAISGSVTSVSGPAPVVGPRVSGAVSAQGSIAVQSGTVVVNRSSNIDQIQVTSPTAVLNWTTLDTSTIDTTTTAINFLPAGTELEFVGLGTDYTILNRIFGTPNGSGIYRGIAFEGTVTSRLSDAGPIGGHVWFYSPGGILLSPTATFNVGGLVLTSSNLQQIDKAGTELNFLGTAEPGSQVMISDGAVVNANDYVVMWAPRVEQAGIVNALGNVSYVGAEQGQLTVTGGLFDMSITVGTEDASGVVHTGTSTGATLVDNPARAITMASVAKNDFVTMLVGGEIGYANASAASVSNGVVILTAGDSATPGSGNIELGAGTFSSSTLLQAHGDVSIKLDGQNQTLNIGGAGNGSDFFVVAEDEIGISATGGSSVVAFDNLFLIAGDGENGGNITINVDDAGRNDDTSISGLLVGGDLSIIARGIGADDVTPSGIGGDGVGGTVDINLSLGGEVFVGGDFQVSATGQGGYGTAASGNATGGTININMDDQFSRFLLQSSATLDASAGPTASDSDSVVGTARGGAINLNLTDGTLAFTGTMQLDVSAQGDDANTPTGSTNGAFGGTIAINNTATIDGDLLTAAASGQGGQGANQFGISDQSATGTGGTITFSNGTGGILNLREVDLTANGTGGDGTIGGTGSSGGDGGTGIGGSVSFTSADDLPDIETITLTANGVGGAGGAAGIGGSGGRGGDGTGGSASIALSGGAITLGSLNALQMNAGATGGIGGAGGAGEGFFGSLVAGAGGTGGDATGGSASFEIFGSGTTYTVNEAQLSFDTDAVGGAGGSGGDDLLGGVGADGGAGGDATGGTSELIANSGTVLTLQQASTDPFLIQSTGTGGQGGFGGSNDIGFGGTTGAGGAGGIGTGGSPTLTARGGTITGDDVELAAMGQGGDGGIGGDDGNATFGPSGNGGGGVGGTPVIQSFDGSPGIVTLGNVTIDATALAGGGTVTGSTAGGQITIADGSADPAGLISMSSLTVIATGSSATPGTPSLTIESDSGPITVTGNVSADVAGDIVFDFDGDGQLAVGNNTTLNAGGDILLTHTNNTAPANSLDIGNDLTATAGGDFDAGADSIIAAGREVSITAQNIGFDVIAAGNDNIFDAGEFAVTLNATNGSIVGGPVGSITALAGMDLDATQAIEFGDMLVNDGPITIDAGTTLTTGDITINQGGLVSNESIFINAGSDTSLGNVVAIDAVTVTSGGLLTAASLRGTGINATAAGAVEIGDATIFNGVAGGGGITISGTSIKLDSADASTAVGNDIALTATAGGLTLGTINTEAFLDATATGDISFDTLTGTGVFLTTTGGDVTGNFASSDRAINSGRPRDVQITATGDVVVTAFETVNDVEITAASFDTDSIITGTGVNGADSDVIVNVTGNARIGFADVQGQMDVDASAIDIGDIAMLAATLLDSTTGDITIGSIVTDGRVEAHSAGDLILGSSEKRGTDTLGNEGMIFTAVGDVTVTGVIDSHDGIQLDAGSAVDAQQLIAFDNVTVTAGTIANIAGITTTVGGNSSVTAPIVNIGASNVAGGFAANATAGDVTLSGDVTANGLIDLDADGDVDFTVLTTGGAVQVNAGGNISGGASLKVGTDTLGNESMSFNAGGDVTFTGNVDTHDNIVINAGGLVDAQQLIAFDNVTVTAASTVDLAGVTTTAGGNASITGSAVTVGASNVAGGFAANATAGGVALTGDLVAAGLINLDATGDIDFATVSTGGQVTVDAGGSITGGSSLKIGTDSLGNESMSFTAGADVTLTGTIDTHDSIVVDAGGAADVNQLTAFDNVTVTAGTVATIANITTTNGGNAVLNGQSIILDTASVNGTLSATTTTGDVSFTGLIDTTNAVTVDSGANLDFVRIENGNGNLSLTAAGNVIGVDAINDAPAGSGGLDRTNIDAGGNILITGVAQSIDDGVFLTAGGDIDVATIDAADTISAIATGAVTVDTAVNANNFAATLRGSSVTLNNGTLVGNLVLDATAGDVAGTGIITVGGAIDLDATGNIGFGSLDAGSSFNADAGGDLVFTSASSGTSTFFNAGGTIDFSSITSGLDITLGAGSLQGGTISTNRLLTISAGSMDTGDIDAGNIIDIETTAGDLIAGSISSPATVGLDSAGSITTGDLTAGGLTLSLTAVDAVSTGVLTTTGTFTDLRINAGGAVDFTSIDASRLVNIRGDAISGGDIVSAAQVDIQGSSLDLGDVTAGAGFVVLESTAGDLNTGDLTSQNFGINVTSAANAVVGDLSTPSASIGITTAGDATTGNADAGSNITYNVGGNLIAGLLDAQSFSPGMSLQIGGDADIAGASSNGLLNIDVGGALTGGDFTGASLTTIDAGSVDIVSASSTGQSVTINATGGDAVVGSTSAATITSVVATGLAQVGNANAPGNFTLRGANATLDSGTIGGSLTWEATAGDIDGSGAITVAGAIDLTATGNVGFGSLEAQGGNFNVAAGGDIRFDAATSSNFIAMTAGGTIGGGDLTATNTVNLDGGSIAVGMVVADAISLISGSDILFDLLQSPNAISVTAANGMIGGNTTDGDIDSDGNVVLDAQSIALGTVDSGGTITANATAGDASFVTTLSTGSTTLDATGDIAVDHAESGVDFSATGGGDFTTGLNTIITAGDIQINMGGTVDLGNSQAGGLIDVQGGQIDFNSITAGTSVDLTATGTVNGGGIDAGTNATLVGSAVTLGASAITGGLSIQSTSGDVLIALDGAEQIAIGGSIQIDANGSITVQHTNNTLDTISLDAGGNILATARAGGIDAQAGSILSGNELILLASGDIDLDDIRAIPGIVVTAGGNVVVNDALAVGPQGVSNFRGITIDAGADPFSTLIYDNAATATITGTVDSYADITIRSGGTTTFTSGSSTVANDRLFVQTGDDIIVESGATLTSARSPSTAPNPGTPFDGTAALELDAGGLLPLLSIPLTPVASLVVDGTLNANSGAIIANAGAIDGLDGNFIASSIALDITDAPNAGVVQSDDNGLLSASCLEGNVCVGNIVADNRIEIGQASNNDVIQLIIQQGTVNANDILVTTRNDIVMGTNGIATTLNGANSFSATSTSGDVNLLDANISSGQILIDAAGSLLGSASLSSANDIGITVGQDVNAASITTGGEVTSVADVGGAAEGFFAVPGSISIGALSVGTGDVNYTAGGDIILGTVVVPGSNINLSAGGLALLDFADTAADVGLDGGSVVFGAIDASGDVRADSGSTIDLATITAGNDINLLAIGAITGGDLDAGGTVFLDGGSIAIGNATANTIGILSDTDILFDLLQSPSAISLVALGGTIGANTGPGDIDSNGDVSLTAQVVAVNDITSGGSVDAQATAGDASFGTVDAANDIAISASGTPTLVNAISGGNTSITGQSVTFDNGTIGGDLSLIATGGDIDGNGAITVGGGIDFDATGNVTFGSLDAQGGDFIVNAGGNIDFASATGSNAVSMIAGGDMFSTAGPGSVTAAGDVSLAAGDIDLGTITSTGGSISITANSDNAFFDSLEADGDIDLLVNELVDVDAITLGGALTVDAGLGFATDGITAGGSIAIASGGPVFLGDTSSGSSIDASGGEINFDALVAGTAITLAAVPNDPDAPSSGDIVGGSTTAGAGASSFSTTDGSIDLSGQTLVDGSLSLLANGGDVDLADVVDTGGALSIGATGAVTMTDGSSGGDLSISGGTSVFANDLSSGGAISISSGTGGVDVLDLAAGDDISIDSLGAILIQNATTPGSFSAQAVDDIGFGLIETDGSVDLVSSGGGDIAGVFADAGTNLTASTSGAFVAQGVFNGFISGTGFTDISADNGITISTLAGQDANLVSGAGAVSVDTDIILDGSLSAQGTSVFLQSEHDLVVQAVATVDGVEIGTTGNLSMLGGSAPGDILLNAGGDLSLLDDTVAGGILLLNATGLVDVEALANGVTIDVFSSDITIGSTGAVGQSDTTQSITFNALASEAVLGGAGGTAATGVYELDNDEFSRVSSGDGVTFIAGDTDTGLMPLTIDELTVLAKASTDAGNGNIGQSGTLSVVASSIDVIGQATVTNATGDTTFRLSASGDIFLDANTGLLEVNEDTGVYTGAIEIEAQNFYAMTADAFADIQGLDIADIDARLADSDGLDVADGVIRAGTLDITTIASDVFIQNTALGTDFDDRRGFTVDQLLISDPNTGFQPIVINGTIGGTTGVGAIPLATITSNFDPGSTINGCLIANPSSCVVTVDPVDSSDDNPLRDLLDEEFNGDPVDTGTIDTSLVELREDPNRQDDPLIDEPVTGAGNEDLWDFGSDEEEDCEQDEDGACLAEAAE